MGKAERMRIEECKRLGGETRSIREIGIGCQLCISILKEVRKTGGGRQAGMRRVEEERRELEEERIRGEEERRRGEEERRRGGEEEGRRGGKEEKWRGGRRRGKVERR